MNDIASTLGGHVLADRIASFHQQLAAQAPAAVLETLGREIAGIIASKASAAAPRVGDTAPDFTLPDARGGEVSLARLRARGPVVVTFYRGQWCPYCDLQLRAYQEVLPQLGALGASLVAISPQTPQESLSTSEKRELAFAVLSDRGNEIARRYGLVFRVPDGLDAIHRGFGIDLERSNGDATNELPVPGTFVVNREGRVAFAFVNADYRVRLEPAELLQRVQRLT